MQKHENTIRMLRYTIQICYKSNINAVVQSFRCPNCDIFFHKTYILERNLTTRSERVKNVYPRNVYQIRETLIRKVESFGIKYTSDQKRFKKLTVFNFDSICVQKETFRDTNTPTWKRKHVPISVSISSNLVEGSIFFCNSNPHHLVAFFIGGLKSIASQTKTKKENNVSWFWDNSKK